MTANFLFVSDDNYVKNLGVCTYSVMHNTCSYVDNVRMFVMDCGITDESKAKLIAQTKRFENAEIIFYDINSLLDEVVPKVENHWHRAIYGRLFLNKILEKYDGIDRIIYLDCDIIVNQPMTELFEIDLQGKCIAGVIDGDESQRAKALHLSKIGYINSGVLVIDTKRWVELDAGKRIIEYINDFPDELLYPDQDAINCVLCDEILTIPLQYNFFWSIIEKDITKMKKNLDIPYSEDDISYALHNIKIMHYAGHDMWSMTGITPVPKKIFFKYRKLSDWRKCRRKYHSFHDFVVGSLVNIKRMIFRES